MLAYYGSKISEHMTKTPEGFLICLGVPIARLGTQEYLPSEIGMTGDSLITVYRTEDEVFNQAALASFEGKPVCMDHPPVAVNPSNSGMYTKGHAEHVRRGTGADADLLVADLFITDADLIRQIENGLRQVSCGYECEYVQDANGRIIQSEIRGNHIAIVQAGRAGSRVSIKDSAPKEPTKKGAMKKMAKKPSVFSHIVAHWAQDAEPDEVAAVIDQMMDPAEDPTATDEDPVTPEVPAAPVTAPDAAPVVAPAAPAAPVTDGNEQIKALLQQILMKLGGTADADPVENLQKEIAGGCDADPLEDPNAVEPVAQDDDPMFPGSENELISGDTEEAVTVPTEEIGDEDPVENENPVPAISKDSRATIAMLSAIKPYLAKLPDAQRRAACDSMTRAYRKAMGRSATATHDGYAGILNTQRNAAKRRAGNAKPVDDAALGRAIMAAHNPHYKNKK